MAFVQGTFLVISDIHSNIEALEAVLADAEQYGPFEKILCAGDIVGYGPDPVLVIERMRSIHNVIVQGNHDEAVLIDNPHGFKDHAAKAVALNRAKLNDEHFNFLRQLQNKPYVDPDHRFAMVHGNFDGDKNYWDACQNRYTITDEEIADSIRVLFRDHREIPIGIFGHTHTPFYTLSGVFNPAKRAHMPSINFIRDITIYLDLTYPHSLFFNSSNDPLLKLLVNPGSVGQPRNNFPDAHYAVLRFEENTVTLSYHRTPYDVQAVQTKLRDRGYPEPLATRLAKGS